jgi:hypothetical protein
MNAAIRDYLAGIGRTGGTAGTGKAKVRGSASYYAELGRKSAAAKKAKRGKKP